MKAKTALFIDCEFKDYLREQYPIDIQYNTEEDAGSFGQLVEVFGKFKDTPRIIQLMYAPGDYVYIGNQRTGKCDYMKDSFTAVLSRKQ